MFLNVFQAQILQFTVITQKVFTILRLFDIKVTQDVRPNHITHQAWRWFPLVLREAGSGCVVKTEEKMNAVKDLLQSVMETVTRYCRFSREKRVLNIKRNAHRT